MRTLTILLMKMSNKPEFYMKYLVLKLDDHISTKKFKALANDIREDIDFVQIRNIVTDILDCVVECQGQNKDWYK